MSKSNTFLTALSVAILCAACGQPSPTDSARADESTAQLPFKVSLAQWSLHKKYQAPGGDPYAFPADAKAMGFEGVEYVTQLYKADLEAADGDTARHRAKAMAVVSRLDSASQAADISEVLIMIDGEGDISSADAAARERAIVNHEHWIDAAARSGIPTVRLNAGGHEDPARLMRTSTESLRRLGAFAKTRNVNVVVENHGGYSSDPTWLRDLAAAVGMDNVGILPDFGNFCIHRNASGDGCATEVARDSTYAAVGMWMPYAHAVSAKSYDFAGDGSETKIDFERMMDTVVAHGYTGFVGIEYEGESLSETAGISATRALLERVGQALATR